MSKLTAVMASTFLAASSAWAQTPAPTTPAPCTTPASPPAAGGGIADYWWLIVLAIIVAAAVWYFSRSRNRTQLSEAHPVARQSWNGFMGASLDEQTCCCS